MKNIIFIMSLTILFLSIKPGIDVISLKSNISHNCCVDECSPLKSNKKSHDKQKQSKEQKGKICNPFQNCNSCVLYISSNTTIQTSKHKISTEQNFNYQTTFHSQFKLDFWQPPKIV